MREQSGIDVRTESIAKVDISSRPFKGWIEGTEEEALVAITADSLIVVTCVFRFFVLRR
jgi:hypothetical protein